MGCHPSTITRLLLLLAVTSACGGDKKPAPKKPKPDDQVVTPPPKAETEEDREKKRRAIAYGIIPEGTTCLPPSLKGADAPRLELSRVGDDPMVCAIDTDPSRMLGALACWKVEDFAEGKLAYQDTRALPSRNITVKLEDRCARGFCIPKEAKIDDLAHVALSEDGSKAVVVSGDDAHIFDATARSRESGFTIRGDKGVANQPRGVYWVGDTIFVHGADPGAPASYVWTFKVDGTPGGAIQTLEKKETSLNVHGGSFSVLGKNKVLLVEKGFSTATLYDVDTGKRTRVTRKAAIAPCKAVEAEAYWAQGDNISSKCRDHMTKTFGYLVGADAILGGTGANLLVLARGARLGDLVVVDLKALKEKNAFQLPWCDAVADADGGGAKDEAPAKKTRGATKKDADKEEDPDQGGQ